MIKEALEYLIKMGNPDTVVINERPYTGIDLKPVRDPSPEPLKIHTLTGIVDYFKAHTENFLGDFQEMPFAHIEDNGCVEIYSWLKHPWEQRHNFLTAQMIEEDQFPFDRYLDHEQFMIQLQSKFVQDETTAQILKVIGNLADEVVKTVMDDGITQGVHVKTGIRKGEETIPNPVSLAPYRTFPEIDQPKNNFVLRLKSGKSGELPQVALIEADGGQWQLEAIQGIKVWLAEKLPELVIIA